MSEGARAGEGAGPAPAAGEEGRYARLASFLSPAPGEPAIRLPEMQPPELRAVGRYRLVRQVARGGASTVYEALDPLLGRRVALKVLTSAADSPHMVARLHREAAIAAQLQHPNIVSVHEAGTVANAEGQQVHFIAMDYIEGRSLAQVLKDRSAGLVELLQIFEDVANAVGYAHARGVVHRDLKPGNVLVENGGRVMLTDFGLARTDAPGKSGITGVHDILGTPQYMAPEQIEGRTKDVGPWTDVYSLGVMLYQILTGRLPHSGRTVADLQAKVLTEPPAAPSSVDPAVDPDLETICLKAMGRSPADRYPGALQLTEDLIRWRLGEFIGSRRPAPRERFRRSLEKRGAVAAAACLGAAAGAVIGGVVLISVARPENPAAAALTVVALGVAPLVAGMLLRAAIPPAPPSPQGPTTSSAPALRRRDSATPRPPSLPDSAP